MNIYLVVNSKTFIFLCSLCKHLIFEIDITNFPTGLYQLVVQNEEYVIMENVIIVE